MSPEQARGHAIDKRSDIRAFGCVLYEMLTGRAVFARETITDTLAAVVEREPDWTALPQELPAAVPRLLQNCLQRIRGAAFATLVTSASSSRTPRTLRCRLRRHP